MLRQWPKDHGDEGEAGAQTIIEQVLNTGLEPVQPAPLLPPIQSNDVELLCWMGIDTTQ